MKPVPKTVSTDWTMLIVGTPNDAVEDNSILVCVFSGANTDDKNVGCSCDSADALCVVSANDRELKILGKLVEVWGLVGIGVDGASIVDDDGAGTVDNGLGCILDSTLPFDVSSLTEVLVTIKLVGVWSDDSPENKTVGRMDVEEPRLDSGPTVDVDCIDVMITVDVSTGTSIN